MSSIEFNLQENRIFDPPASLVDHAAISGMSEYQDLCTKADQDYESYWGELAKQRLVWQSPFGRVLDDSTPPFYKWFEQGTLNVSYNCLDRHVHNGLRDKTAIIFESDEGKVTKASYEFLLKKTSQIANALKEKGVQKGDRVLIYMPMSIEGVCAMQACARIGAIHSVVFGGFSSKSVNDRIQDTAAKLIITADEQIRGGKVIPLKPAVDQAIQMGGCDSVETVIVFQRTGNDCSLNKARDIWWHDIVDRQLDFCEPAWVEAEHPLFILYTSGSTGKPKGVQHSSAGYLLHATLTMQWTFDFKKEDVFWCTADIGWITGHTYVAYGPLSCGGTQIVFEGVPTYPDAGRFWKMIQDHRVSIFYTAPTAIRSLVKASEINKSVHPKNYDLSSLRILGTVGEPINPEAWMWYYQNVGNEECPIMDTFWQTETGGHVITPLPGVTPLVPGSCTLPFPGIDAAVVDETGKEVEWGQGGFLVIKKPWPSMIRTIWDDSERFKKEYFPEELGGRLYLAGDGAVRDQKTGYFTIMGRIDDVLNISGHRMGTMEIESALVAHDLVAEAAVVGRENDVSGEAICAFVVLKQDCPKNEQAKEVAQILRNWVASEIGPIAKPKEIRFGDNLPKTRSGKIMRRLLRSLAKGEAITQDMSTLENPAILEQLKDVC